VIYQSLSLVNFRNYAEAGFTFSPDVNVLVGDNGSGKTTVLDALYYLSFCKSYLNPIDSQNVRYASPFFMVQASVQKHGEVDKLHCGVKPGQKKQFRRNDKEYSRLADHIGRYPAVMLTPNDVDLIKEGSEVRRKFIDGIISQYDRKYLDQLIDYNRGLQQRNNLLRFFAENRTFDEESLIAWDEQLIGPGTYIHEQRKKFVEAFTPVFNDLHRKVSGGAEEVGLEYLTPLDEAPFSELLSAARMSDRNARRTTVGTHKDDLNFTIQEHPVKKFGSQGQQKTYLIALKLAQSVFIEQATGVKPVLLLDDIFDKIDDKRVSALMQLVSQRDFGQIFITDTHEQRIPKLFEDVGAEMKVFHIHRGEVINEEQTADYGAQGQ
jgi:DNA replication and repair protein RecF